MLHILAVEDEPDGQEVLALLLTLADMQVDRAGTAEEALKKLHQSNDYDAVVIDLALPGMDGFQLLGAIRTDDDLAHLPCVAITAYHDSGVRQEALAMGFDAYFPKPLDDRSFSDDLHQIILAQST